MRSLSRMLLALVAALLATSAFAWNYDDLWVYSAVGPRPGGGGNWGTGGKRDHGLTCAQCHTQGAGNIDLTLTFTPPLATRAGQPAYVPGVRYTVQATMTGEHLAVGTAGQVNNFAITFEGPAGQTVGALASDSGQSTSACPANILAAQSQALDAGSTTITAGTCHAVAGRGRVRTNLSSWRFSWTAPAAGAGTVTAFWGVVDGDGKEDSVGDDEKAGSLVMQEGP